jgi:branched-chain amino acid transport system ATP-binding protein/branched-chain amino acid transport system permease protein
MFKRPPLPLFIAGSVLLVLPPVLLALGLTMTSASEVVIYSMACMALNILVGHTGLVSFGHGAWFGLAAYAAALTQRNLMPDSFFGATISGVLIVAAIATPSAFSSCAAAASIFRCSRSRSRRCCTRSRSAGPK